MANISVGRDLYRKTHMESGLTFLKKLKHERLNLNSYSRMGVDLAAQVRCNTSYCS